MKNRLNQKIIAVALSLLAIVLIAVPAFAAKAPQMENNYCCPACGRVFTNAKKWEKHREKCFYEADGPAYYPNEPEETTSESTTAEETTAETTTEYTTVTETAVPETTVAETVTSTEAPSQVPTLEATTRIVTTTVKKTEVATVKRTPVMYAPEATEATVIKTLNNESTKATVTAKVSESVVDDFETESNVDDEFLYSEDTDAISDDIPSTGSSKGVVIALALVIIASAAIIAVKRKDDNIGA